MPDLVNVKYKQTGKSKKTNAMGMREMQERAFEARTAQYLLIKAPPASGKSRALMFIGLDKLRNQGLSKVIVAVPERSIGSSFEPTPLKKFGFFEDWNPNPRYNLCTPGTEKSKVDAFINFMKSKKEILICTHATLRFAFDAIDEKELNNTVIAIDEFHHVSAEGTNRLGSVLNTIMEKSTAHIVAMTGSYFRGDSVPILLPEIEAKFIKVKYDYYEQLNGYEHLKSLGIGYHFYQRKYTTAIHEVLDENKKTIIHIPSVNSGESTKDKYEEVGKIIETIGDLDYQDPNTGVLYVTSNKTGNHIKIADLVNDDQKARDRIQNYLRNIKSAEDIDIIIALGMAKEGFDWPYCEQALTIGYRGSLTEIIQIIGRATRDSDNKTHAQFTNLIAQPDAQDDEVKLSVNNMLKAITASLLMEQVLAPNFKFKTKYPEEEGDDDGGYKDGNEKTNTVNEDENTIHIRGFKEPSTAKVSQIIESDLNDLKAKILQDNDMLKAMPSETLEPEVINQVLIPKIIRETYPELSDDEVEEVRQHIVVDSVIKNGTIEEQGNRKFIKMADTFVNIDDIHIDLIDSVNPFQKAFEILSKSVTAPVLRTIQETIDASRISMTEEEAIILWPKIKAWVKKTGKNPDIKSLDPKEKRMAEAVIFIKELKENAIKMPKKKLSIEDIFEDDDLGILDENRSQSQAKTSDTRLVESFEEINTFYDDNNREPEQDNGISEMRLYLRLKGFRENEKNKFQLKDYDRHNLLFAEKKPESIDDILNDDLDILGDDDIDESIFEFKHTPKERKESDFVAQRKPMSEKEFVKYDKLFKKVHKEIKLGLRSLKPFKNVEKNLKEGKFYILDGILLYLEVGDISEAKRDFGGRERKDVRTRTVFDNGTYSNMFYRSLGKQLYNNGRIVTDLEKDAEKELFTNAELLEEDDKETGWIYVLKSKSTNPEISKIKDLHKIGFSTVPVQKRLINATKEATYLYADVEVVATFKCVNVNTQKFENLLHQFFKQAQLQIDIYDNKNNRITPREWFVVPYDIIERAIGLFISRDIVNYVYDFEKQRINKFFSKN